MTSSPNRRRITCFDFGPCTCSGETSGSRISTSIPANALTPRAKSNASESASESQMWSSPRFSTIGSFTMLPSGPRAIPLDLPDAVARRDSVHAAAGMRSAGTLIQAVDRRPVVRVSRRGAHVKELFGRELAVEDVPADQTPLALHVVWPDHLSMQHPVRESRRELVVPGATP